MQQNQTETLLRLSQIIGDKKNNIAPIVPVSRSTWWLWVKKGHAPTPLKLGPRTTCWRASDVFAFIERISVKGVIT